MRLLVALLSSLLLSCKPSKMASATMPPSESSPAGPVEGYRVIRVRIIRLLQGPTGAKRPVAWVLVSVGTRKTRPRWSCCTP